MRVYSIKYTFTLNKMKLLICFSSKWEHSKILPILSIYPHLSTLYIYFTDKKEIISSTYQIQIQSSDSKNISSSITKNNDIFFKYDHILLIGHSSISLSIASICHELDKKIIHIDAGKHNSVFSKLANYHLCSSLEQSAVLIEESTPGTIFITGSTHIDIIKQYRPIISLENMIIIYLENTRTYEEQWFTTINKLTQLFPEFAFIVCYKSIEMQPYLYLLPTISIIQSIEYLPLIEIISKSNLVISDTDELLETCSYLQKKIITFLPDSNICSNSSNHFLCNSLESIIQIISDVLPLSITSNKYLYGDGTTLSKINSIFTSLQKPIEIKFLSISNYRTLQPINKHFAFIITSKVTNSTQQILLLESIRHIRSIYPKQTIYLIDDQSMYPLKDNVDIISNNITVVDSIAKGGGEINPYLFSIDPRCNSETLIYLHDSAFLKSSIDSVIASSESSFLPIWYSKKFIWDDVFDPINQSIRISMLFYSDDLSTSITLNELLLYFKKNPKLQFVVTFSGMSIFHHSFVQFIKKYTNFFLITHLFTCRKNRCLFERILSCIYFWIYRNSYPSSVCGDINEHPLCFRNTNIYINNYHNAFIKVWQGR